MTWRGTRRSAYHVFAWFWGWSVDFWWDRGVFGSFFNYEVITKWCQKNINFWIDHFLRGNPRKSPRKRRLRGQFVVFSPMALLFFNAPHWIVVCFGVVKIFFATKSGINAFWLRKLFSKSKKKLEKKKYAKNSYFFVGSFLQNFSDTNSLGFLKWSVASCSWSGQFLGLFQEVPYAGEWAFWTFWIFLTRGLRLSHPRSKSVPSKVGSETWGSFVVTAVLVVNPSELFSNATFFNSSILFFLFL